jgi:very-short-patch-repair endonuclease
MGKTTKLTQEEFIERCKKIHGDKYDYSLTEYKGSHTKVKIICPIHGEFKQLSVHHTKGGGCSKCSRNKKLTQEEFIERSKKIYGDKYDYSKTKYINLNTKVEIVCKIHGSFIQSPEHHMNGHSCSFCNNVGRKTTEQYIEKAKKTHNNFYDYSLTEFINNKIKVKIICPKHGEFLQDPKHHLNGVGCPSCNIMTTEIFIEKSKNIHGNLYGYSKVNYIRSNKKIIIECFRHGNFEQEPNNHLQGRGCPKCKLSSGEKIIHDYLSKNNIEFEIQKKFDECKYRKFLKFDFFLSDYNICVEYDGEQHFTPINYFGGQNRFETTKITDNIKTTFCEKNGIFLLRINYKENIEEKLQWLINYLKTMKMIKD